VCFACVSIHEHTLFRVRQLLCVCARALEERNRECVREREEGGVGGGGGRERERERERER